MSVQLSDGTNSNVVDATSKGILVQNPKVAAQAGFAAASSILDSGAVTGSVLARAVKATTGNRQEVSIGVPLFTDTFNYAAQDTGRWNSALTTFTLAYGAGGVVINSGNSTAANAVALLKTYAQFQIPVDGAVLFRIFATLSVAPQAHNVMELGLFYAATTAAPTDGVLFRYDATGVLKGVVNFNGTEITTPALTAPSSATAHKYEICIDDGRVEFWIDGVLQGVVIPTGGVIQPVANVSLQPCIRHYIDATGGGTAIQLKVNNLDLLHLDSNPIRSSILERAEQGFMGYQGVSGMTMGSTALYANSANPTAAVPTNTTAALGSGLGGQFWETASLAVNTDGIIASFQVPAPTVNIPGRKLVITGIRWMSMVQTVLAGGPFIYQCGLAFGHTAVSLATAEAAATKAPRRVALGLYTLPVTAPVGSAGANFDHQFASPIVVNPGEFVATFVKNIGTVGTSGTIAHSIVFDAHWE